MPGKYLTSKQWAERAAKGGHVPRDVRALLDENEQMRDRIGRMGTEINSLRRVLWLIENHELRDHEDYSAIQDIAREALRNP